MATVTFTGTPVRLSGELPAIREPAHEFGGIKGDLSVVVVNPDENIEYEELMSEITSVPDYEKAPNAVSAL